MPVKIKGIQAIDLLDLPRIKRDFFKETNRFIARLIVSFIKKGISPVQAGGKDPRGSSGRLRYQKYSDSYTDAMGSGKLSQKKKRPVNLTLTGKMLKSIRVKSSSDALEVSFTDEKAIYHDVLGAGKSKTIRRMLPHDGEDFNPRIRRKIVDALNKVIKKSAK